jgi:hypothetical protein
MTRLNGITPEQCELAVKLYLAGKSSDRVAAETGMCSLSVKKAVLQAGYTMRQATGRRYSVDGVICQLN